MAYMYSTFTLSLVMSSSQQTLMQPKTSGKYTLLLIDQDMTVPPLEVDSGENSDDKDEDEVEVSTIVVCKCMM